MAPPPRVRSTLSHYNHEAMNTSLNNMSALSSPTRKLEQLPSIYEALQKIKTQRPLPIMSPANDPTSALFEAALNVQLSLLKLRDLKDIYRNRYRIPLI